MELFSTQTARFKAPARIHVPESRPDKTIFLVHTEARPGSGVKAALQERGYQVIHADSVDAAHQTWAKLGNPVHLFLADITLGRDQSIERLVKLLQAENPRMRVLYANDLEQAPHLIGAPSYAQQLVSVVDNCLA